MGKFALVLMVFWPLYLVGDVVGSLSTEQCQPGDLVELRVQSSFENYTSLVLSLPDREDWVLLAHEVGPVRYSEGLYKQEAIILFQPLQAGGFDFKDIEVTGRSAKGTSVLTLALPILDVQPYTAGEDSDEPMRLPEPGHEKASPVASHLSWMITAFAFFMVGLIARGLWIHRRKESR